MDADGYPSLVELKRIREWPASDVNGLIRYVYERWRYADDGGFHRRGSILRLHTFGWSGNEDLIGALAKNSVFWLFYWRTSRRGGHYSFEIKNLELDI